MKQSCPLICIFLKSWNGAGISFICCSGHFSLYTIYRSEFKKADPCLRVRLSLNRDKQFGGNNQCPESFATTFSLLIVKKYQARWFSKVILVNFISPFLHLHLWNPTHHKFRHFWLVLWIRIRSDPHHLAGYWSGSASWRKKRIRNRSG